MLPISDRITTAQLQSRYKKFTLIKVYAPMNAAENPDRDEFYELLHGMMEATPENDMEIVMGDFNAQICKDNSSWEEVMG